MTGAVDMLKNACLKHLQKLKHYCAPDARLTLIVRIPGKPESELVVSQDIDNLKELVGVLERNADRVVTARSNS